MIAVLKAVPKTYYNYVPAQEMWSFIGQASNVIKGIKPLMNGNKKACFRVKQAFYQILNINVHDLLARVHVCVQSLQLWLL